MHAKKRELSQEELFKSRLDQMLDPKHPLFRLANAIDWKYFEKEFGKFYVENVGRPGKPIRILVGLHYLKNAYDESDESCVERFLENPYWQYFCGFEHFQHEFPLKPTTLVKWRQRIGKTGIEKLFYQTLLTAQKLGLLNNSHLNKVNIDTTVQEKAIAYPTDAQMKRAMRETKRLKMYLGRIDR